VPPAWLSENRPAAQSLLNRMCTIASLRNEREREADPCGQEINKVGNA
jgi:hypothetical protein